MDPTSVMESISRLIQTTVLLESRVKCLELNCQTLVHCIKPLGPFLHEVQESKLLVGSIATSWLSDLETFLIDAKELLESLGPNACKFYVVLRSSQYISRFQEISEGICSFLRKLQGESLPLSEQIEQQLNECISNLEGTRYFVDKQTEQLTQDVMVAVTDTKSGMRLDSTRLDSFAQRFGCKLNQEVLREASLLEHRKDLARREKNKVEEDVINQLISLATQISDDLVEQKQAQAVVAGVPIPTDFRCPLSLELMLDPVIIASGQTYERAYIQQWLEQGNTSCPKTRQVLSHRNLIPNFTVKALISNWCESYNIPFPQPPKFTPLEGVGGVTGTARVSIESAADSSLSVANTPALEEKGSRVSNATTSTTMNTTATTTPESENALRNGACVDPDLAVAHSRNTSTSSSLASSLDDMHLSSSSPLDDNSSRGPHLARVDSSPYNSDMSGELDAPSYGSSHGRRYHEDQDSPVSRPYGRRFSDVGSNRVIPPSSELIGIDGNSIRVEVEQAVEGLLSNSPEVQRKAASELRLLAKHSSENRIIIASCGAIKPLVMLLSSDDLATQEDAVTALLNLSINDNNKHAIAAAGAIDSLVEVLKVGTPPSKENAAATLFSLSVMNENKVAIGQSGAIPPLVDLLINGTPRGKKDAATALFNLSILQENKARIVRAGAVKPLVDLMIDPAAGMVDKAVAVLANLATIHDGRLSIGNESGIRALVEVVEMGSLRGKENAAAALLHLCTHSNQFRWMVLQEGAIPPLVALSKSGTARAKEKASALLRLFREQRHGIGRAGADRFMDRP